MKFLFLMLMLCGCFKTGKSLQDIVNEGRYTAKDCVLHLKKKFDASECHQVHHAQNSDVEIWIKCAGYDLDKENYWNKHTFRLSWMGIKYNEEDQKTVNSHTICTDNTWRIEVYQ